MAIANLVQILTDTNKRAVVKMTGSFDGTGQETDVIKVDVSNLTLALNSNGYVMAANVDPKSTYRVYPTRVWYDVNTDGYVRLFYDSAGGVENGTILYLSGRGLLDAKDITIVNPVSAGNSNGDICLTTLGALANDSYSIIMELRKEPQDYDQGQTADPAAFNKGSWGIA